MNTNILLVDDEPEVEGMIKLKFRREIRNGVYQFTFARNGLDALEKLKISPEIDIVISDINMPEMDGLTLLQHLRNNKRNLKSIIVSAYGDMDNIRTAMNRGAYDFLTKPIDFDDLTITIEKTKEAIKEIKENIEARKKAEASLLESMALNHAIVNHAIDAIVTIDSEGVINSMNAATEIIFGYENAELLGKNISVLMPEPYRSMHDSYVHEYLGTGNKTIIGLGRETIAVRKDGTVFPVELTVSEISVNNKIMFNGIIRDITERKKAEKVLREYNETLTEEVDQRTRELRQLNQEKNDILGIAVHDLKNPLMNIKMLAKLIFEEPTLSMDEIREFTGDILSTSERMFELIKNLLDVNRIEQGKIAFNPEHIPVSPLVSIIVKSFAEHALQKNITVSIIDETNGDETVLSDRTALVQILENLVSNAVKYSPLGSNVNFKIRDESDYIRFSVKDEGPGINEEDMKRLFGKFARLTAQPTGGEHSTGLGLSIVKKLTELMKGKVWCESTPGKGAEFIVLIPRKEY